ncbi:MAG: hypothetical protein WBM70_01665 [Sulfurovum sp.]|uniref:hypothetical protein n=1 Tax=Sulfurovum sp. TaxID=1969726 RepID=UPI003C72B972
MTIMKYILFALLLFGLWVTEPLWLKSNTNQTSSPIKTQITEQERQRAELIASEAARLKELETKFGPKPYGKYSTGVPASIYQYWERTLKYPDSLEEERCRPIRAGDKGWTTVCRYRVKNSSGSLQLMQDTFIIKDGVAYK